MQTLKALFQKGWTILKTSFQKGWSNKWIKNIMIFIVVMTPLLIIDQVTKGVVFNGDKSGNASTAVADWKFIAFRSQFHTSTTFLDFIGTKLPLWSSLLIDYILIAVFSAILAYSRTKFSAISCSVALAGILGNTIDASHFHGVRNVFFIPWRDNGTFNFADVIIVVGSVLTGLSFLWNIFKSSGSSKSDDSKQVEETPKNTEIDKQNWFRKSAPKGAKEINPENSGENENQ